MEKDKELKPIEVKVHGIERITKWDMKNKPVATFKTKEIERNFDVILIPTRILDQITGKMVIKYVPT